VGSVKTNIGHLEGAAGLAGLIKSILVLENGQIPATLHFRHPNPRIPFSAWRIKVASESVPWPAQGYRRVSVNSFGFGGTNAHAILDDAYHYLSARGMVGLHNTRLSDIPPQRPRSTVSEPGRMHSSGIDGSAVIAPHSTSKIFVWSAADKQSLLRLRDAFAKHLLNVQSALESPCSANQDQYLCRLAYTLSEKRSRFPWKTCVTASSISRLCEELSTESLSMNRSKHNSRTAFVFTGQGAQWAEMGVSFFQYPVFYDCIRTADSFLQSLGCSWSALEELRRKAHESNIDLPEYSQPLCTILQVALVDLLSSWNVKPSAVVGHSSGEIAAAYAAGAITRSDAWSLSFGRGGTSPKLKSLAPKTRGAMIALAVSEEKAFTIIRKITCGQVVVACINSPISVTLSGNEEAIEEVEVICKVSSIFARRLKVQQAYHSPQMEVAAPSYLEAIKDVTAKSSTQGCKMYSSVTGQFIDGSALGPSYWVQNMVSPVRFFGAVNSLLGRSTDEEFDADIGIDCLLEIGPHSTLQGPLSQILKFHSIKNLPYLSMLQRHKDGIQTSMNSMRAFFIMGAPVNIDKLNNAHVPAPISYQMLTDLPSYMWNHSRSYWHESRLSRNYRFRSQPRLDLLGAPCPDSDSSEWKWRGFLRTKDTPWIRDHEVLSSILYPAAGFIVMALEAAHQIASPEKVVQEYEFREVQIEKAAVIVDDSFGLECVLQLRPHELGASNETTLWYRFRVSTCAEGEDLQENCSGLINIKYTSTEQSALMRMERVLEHKKCVKRYEELRKSCQKSQDPVKFYSEMSAIGLAYGPTFRNITAIKTGQSGSCCTVEIPEISSTMPGGVEFPHLLHPTTLDTIFQTIFAGSRNALGQRPKAFVPTSIRSVRISARLPTTAGSTLQVFSTLQRHGLRGIEAEVYALDGLATEANIMIHGLRCSEIPMSSNVESGFRDKTHCAQVIWRPALDLLSGDQIQDLIEPKSDERMTPRQVVAMSQQAAVSLIHRTLEKVTLSQITSPHLKTFYQWMLEQEDKNANSYKRHKSAPSECSIADFEAPVNLNGNKSIDEELVWHIGTNLEKILTGHADPLQILLDKDLLYRYYKTSIGMDKMHSKLATVSVQHLSPLQN
jgi:acyl transferase domain-containing protein